MPCDAEMPERVGQAIGLSGAANLVTNALGPGVAEPLAAGWGWRAVFVGAAIAAACAVALGLAQGTLYPVVTALLFEDAEPTRAEG